MVDLVKLILAQIPLFVGNFLSLFTAPKAFVRERNQSGEDNLSKSLTFLGISFALTMILTAPLMPMKSESVQFVVTRGVYTLITVILGAVAVWLAWLCVGGRPEFARLLITYFYQSGILTVLSFIVIILCPLGLAKALDPEMYPKLADLFINPSFHHKEFSDFITQAARDDPFGRHNLVYWAYILMQCLGTLATLAWMFAFWGAYRELSGVSRVRSFWASVLLYFLFFPIFGISWLLFKA